MFEAEERQWWYVGHAADHRRPAAGPWLGLGERRRDGRHLARLCSTPAAAPARTCSTSPIGTRRRGCRPLAGGARVLCRDAGAEVVRGSVLRLPVRETGPFDCVTSFDVLYHAWVRDDGAAVAELVRVLAPGGVLFVRCRHCACSTARTTSRSRPAIVIRPASFGPSSKGRVSTSCALTLLQQPPLPVAAAAAHPRSLDGRRARTWASCRLRSRLLFRGAPRRSRPRSSDGGLRFPVGCAASMALGAQAHDGVAEDLLERCAHGSASGSGRDDRAGVPGRRSDRLGCADPPEQHVDEVVDDRETCACRR